MARATRLIVDATNFVHRAFHTNARGLGVSATMPPDADHHAECALLPPAGMDFYPTGVLFAALGFFVNLLTKYVPDQVVFVWDAPFSAHETWRYGVYHPYKKQRRDREREYTDDERLRRKALFKVECSDVRDMVVGLGGINITAPPGVEADDVISHLVRNLTDAQRVTNVIISADTDFLQLVEPYRTEVYSLSRDRRYFGTDEFAIKASGDVPADSPPIRHAYQLVYLKALLGDTSDNVPGVSGVGTATAGVLARLFVDLLYDLSLPADDWQAALATPGKSVDVYLKRITTDFNVQRATVYRAANAFTMLQQANSAERQAFTNSLTLVDISGRPYVSMIQLLPHVMHALRDAARAYVGALRIANQTTEPRFAVGAENVVCAFASFFGKRGFGVAFDDERRIEIALRARELHRRQKRFIHALALHAKEQWRAFV